MQRKIAIARTGYVGSTVDVGHKIICVDKNGVKLKNEQICFWMSYFIV